MWALWVLFVTALVTLLGLLGWALCVTASRSDEFGPDLTEEQRQEAILIDVGMGLLR